MLCLQSARAAALARPTVAAFEAATGLNVLHLSAAVAVVDKPSGLRSVPARGAARQGMDCG